MKTKRLAQIFFRGALVLTFLLGVGTVQAADGEVQRVLRRAAELAAQQQQGFWQPIHVLTVLVQEMASSGRSGEMADIAAALKITPEAINDNQILPKLLAATREATPKSEKPVQSVTEGDLGKRLMERIKAVAGDKEPTLAHLLVATLDETTEREASIVMPLGLDASQAANELSVKNWSAKDKKGGKSALEEMGRNLTTLIKADQQKEPAQQKFFPAIGRDDEIEFAFQVLLRDRKSNPALLAPKGVGKTAVAEGMAYLIATGLAPEGFLDKEIVEISLSDFMSGTKHRGELEEKIKMMLAEVVARGNVILFIDEVHLLNSLGGDTEGGSNIANLLKPAMARGDISIIGATTLDEYRQYIEKDSALERRFQPVPFHTFSREELLAVIVLHRERLQRRFGVRVPNEVVARAIQWSDRLMKNQEQPDKAITALTDAVTAAVYQRMVGVPSMITKLRNKIRYAADAIEFDRGITPMTADLEKSIQDQIAVVREMEDRLAELVQELEDCKRLKSEIAALNAQTDRKVRENKLEELGALQKRHGFLEDSVTIRQLAQVFANYTGESPEEDANVTEARILEMEAELERLMIGQPELKRIVMEDAAAYQRKLSDPDKLRSVILVAGPSGTGASRLSKILPQVFYGSKTDHKLLEFNMANFRLEHQATDMFGSSRGYVGGDKPGRLLEFVSQNPQCVIAFDKIELAHPAILESVMEIIDKGGAYDNKGKWVSFRGVSMIMTTEAGRVQADSDASPEDIRKAILDELEMKGPMAGKPGIGRNLLEKIPHVVGLRSLTPEQMGEVLSLQLEEGTAKVLKDMGIRLVVDPEARDAMLALGYNKQFNGTATEPTARKYGLGGVSKLLGQFKQAAIDAKTNRVSYDAENKQIVYYPGSSQPLTCTEAFAALSNAVTLPAETMYTPEPPRAAPAPPTPTLTDEDQVGGS
ncbi:AAA family ATPase [bacterium]|nr:AAA family ATPase [bacterium]